VQVGELEIPGFSNYLHPLGDNLVVGVGQDIVDDRTVGLEISLFNVSDFAKPVRIANFVEETGDGSTSDVQYNPKAFRLFENGLLILPVEVHDWTHVDTADEERQKDKKGKKSKSKPKNKSFDGFKVYNVNKDEKTITDYFQISHGSNFFDGCWSWHSMAPRSLVLGGDLWTMKSHTILVHDWTDRSQVGDHAAAINLDENLSGDECTPCYFFNSWPVDERAVMINCSVGLS
jgi:Beta propeller domain